MRACARTRTYKRVHLCTQTEPSPTRTAGYSLQGAVNRFCSKSQRAGLFLHLAGGGGRGADLPLNSRCRIPHHQQVSQTRKETGVSPGCKLFKSISKRAGKQGTDLLGPLQRNGVLLKVSVTPRTLISSRGDQPVEEQPPLSGVLCQPPSAARARCTTEPGRPMPRAGGGEIQSWAKPKV